MFLFVVFIILAAVAKTKGVPDFVIVLGILALGLGFWFLRTDESGDQ